MNSGDEIIEPEAFRALDADGDGVVSKEDLKNKLQQLVFVGDFFVSPLCINQYYLGFVLYVFQVFEANPRQVSGFEHVFEGMDILVDNMPLG